MTSSTTIVGVLQRVILIVVLASVMSSVTGKDNSGPLTLQPGKDPRCHWMNMHIKECKAAIEPILRYSFAGWYYHEVFSSCRPWFSQHGIVHCEQNLDLQMTKDECDEICGTECAISDGRPGVCMMERFCPKFQDPDPSYRLSSPSCREITTKCCPRRVIYPKKDIRFIQSTIPTTTEQPPNTPDLFLHIPYQIAETTVQATLPTTAPTTVPPK